MQNKPNFRKAKMNVNAFSQKDYENETTFRPKKTNPNKPNFKAFCEKGGILMPRLGQLVFYTLSFDLSLAILER